MIYALIFTLGIAVVDIYSKQERKMRWYVIIYVLMLFGQWVFANEIHSEEVCVDGVFYQVEHELTEDARIEIEFMKKVLELKKL